jgi:hypothetical protein
VIFLRKLVIRLEFLLIFFTLGIRVDAYFIIKLNRISMVLTNASWFPAKNSGDARLLLYLLKYFVKMPIILLILDQQSQMALLIAQG